MSNLTLTQEAERIQAMKKHISLLPFNPTPDEVEQIIKAVLMAEYEIENAE